MAVSRDASDSIRNTPVFIVGGGPVGLAMALLLHRFDIDCVVAEKSPATTNHPKSRGCFPRTMELFRQWGVEDAIRARGLPDESDVFAFVESVGGKVYGRSRPEPNTGLTPAWKCLVAQDAVEEEIFGVLKNSHHARVLFSTECVSFKESAAGVEVRVRAVATGEEQEWHAQYLVAADGAGSQTRRSAEIEMVGPAVLAVMANEYWRGDLSQFPIVRDTAGFFIVPSDPRLPFSSILNTNGRDRWLTLFTTDPEKPRTESELVDLVRAQTGVPKLGVELISRSVWRMSRQVAAQFRRGRVFLAGDAGHRFPPTGGYGLNTGVQDAHNLAWKLAFVIKGLASERLLDTYDTERRPIAESNADFSLGNSFRIPMVVEAIRHGNPDEIAFRINDMDNHIHSVGQSLGFSYEQGGVIPDGTIARPLDPRTYHPSDRPGGRFPHLWLDLARQHSTLDWFDQEFVIVAGPLGIEWLEAGRHVSEKLSIPIGVRTLPLPNPHDGILMGMRGAVLVRPDGHVAWRMPWLPSDPGKELAIALSTLLH